MSLTQPVSTIRSSVLERRIRTSTHSQELSSCRKRCSISSRSRPPAGQFRELALERRSIPGMYAIQQEILGFYQRLRGHPQQLTEAARVVRLALFSRALEPAFPQRILGRAAEALEALVAFPTLPSD